MSDSIILTIKAKYVLTNIPYILVYGSCKSICNPYTGVCGTVSILHSIYLSLSNLYHILPLVPTSPPGTIIANSYTPFSVNITWNPVATANLNGNLYLYQVFFKKLYGTQADTLWDNFGTQDTKLTLIDLQPGTWYGIRILASNPEGNGVASPLIKIQTIEGGILLYFNLLQNCGNAFCGHHVS